MQSLTLVIVNAAYTLRPTTNTSPYPYFWYGCLHDKHAVKMEDMEVSAEDAQTKTLCRMHLSESVTAEQDKPLSGPSLSVAPLLHHSGRNVSLRHAVRLWHVSLHALLNFPHVFFLAPAMRRLGVWLV